MNAHFLFYQIIAKQSQHLISNKTGALKTAPVYSFPGELNPLDTSVADCNSDYVVGS